MKYLIFFLSTACLSLPSHGQTQHDTIPVYEASSTNLGIHILKIPVNFNQSQLPAGIHEALKDQTIERVDLVYTTYKESESFDQIALNSRRKNNLLRKFPALKSPVIEWKSFGQAAAKNKLEAKSMFHGFVVHYRPRPTAESMKMEVEFIDLILEEGLSMEEAMLKTRHTPHETSLTISTLVSEIEETITPEEAFTIPSAASAMPDGCYIQISGSQLLKQSEVKEFLDSLKSDGYINVGYSAKNKTKAPDETFEFSYIGTKVDPDCEEGSISSEPIYSARLLMAPYTASYFDAPHFDVVKATFERHPEWKNTLVFVDVTGSMAPYIAKTFAWVKDTQDKELVEAFTFFNDGDRKRDNEKRTGSVGGIYYAKNSSFDKVKNTMRETMLNGGGGDCPENNFEAVIKGVKKFPNCDELVMVADNYATPRDLSLLNQIDRPLHIILCGANQGINIEYVRAAYRTGGSVHTIEEDLELRDIPPGTAFQIGQNHFTILDGEIFIAQRKR